MNRLDFAIEQLRKYGFEEKVLSPVPPWVEIGKHCMIHENVMLGTEGFGYERDVDGVPIHIVHSGKLIIGDNVHIYPFTTVNRATVDETIIGDWTAIDHHVHVGHSSIIGKRNIICAGTIICGSVTIGDDCWIGAGCIIKQKVKIGNNVTIGAGAVVVKDVPDGVTVAGVPARPLTFK